MQGIRKVGRMNTFSDDDHYNGLKLNSDFSETRPQSSYIVSPS